MKRAIAALLVVGALTACERKQTPPADDGFGAGAAQDSAMPQDTARPVLTPSDTTEVKTPTP